MKSAMQTAPALLTYDDYCRIPEDGRRYEVIQGTLYMAPAPFYRHQKIIMRLSSLLDQFVQDADAGEVLIAPFDVLLSEHNVVQPDILFIAKENLSILTEKNAHGTPDLMIEVLSKSNRSHDEIRKRKLYEMFGVREYWIVDPQAESITMYKHEGDRFGTPNVFLKERNDILKSKLLKTFSCSLTDIF